jgi:hypothetical protein
VLRSKDRSVSDFHQGHLHVFKKRHSIMRKLDVGPTIDAASWRCEDGGVYARVPRRILLCEMVMVFLVGRR